MSKRSLKFAVGSSLALTSALGAGALLAQSALAQLENPPAENQSVDRSVAQSVESHQPSASALADLAFGYAIAQQPETAISLLERAEAYEGGTCKEANTWLKIGVGYRAAGQLEKGEAFLAQAGETMALREQENCAGSATSPSESVANRIVDYAEAGHLDVALHIAQSDEVSFHSLIAEFVAVQVAKESYEAGRRKEAKEIITRSIQNITEMTEQEADPTIVNQAILGVAGHFSAEGNAELAKFVLEESDLVALQLSADNDSESSAPVLEQYQSLQLARILVDIERPQQALNILEALTANVQASSEFPTEIVRTWVEAATLYSKLDGKLNEKSGKEKADDAMATANANLSQMPDVRSADEAKTVLVRGYAELSQFDQASELAKSIESVNARQSAYVAIVSAYTRAGLVEDAEQLAESIGMSKSVRLDMMRAYLKTEQYDEAQQIAEQPDMLNHLPEVGQAYCKAGMLEQAVSLIDRLEPAEPSTDWLRGCTATAFAEQGQFDQALEIAQSMAAPAHKADALIEIAAQHTAPPSSFWQRWMAQLPSPFDNWLGGTPASTEAVELLDQARTLIER
ncbi:lipopolysaccharide assembly protein LapB [cf. Phormidesmis sp. LEGE 11477]|uniref:tetratricopeptide repeat protein n=1 Tax=cf. Phormidesmis sp. LEGE 11477 TaxID=1828680 RepID=UPI00188235C9|nr:hypothetical protein [cf. Phormidesmis sp. LEGE 11477]MBE9063598.1 hypothetical protein [cf. Phormidesmis sp. LEGE 11477]